MNTLLHTRCHGAIDTLEQLDWTLREWALSSGSNERKYPVLIAAETLHRAEYHNAFPHLLMAPAVAADPAQSFAQPNIALTGWMLSPAVCYHAYAQLAGRILERGQMLTARGHCFRNEEKEAVVPGRRQVEFEMRELILIGAPDWIEQHLHTFKPSVEQLARGFGLVTEWRPASDPFFLPRAGGKAHMQRLLGSKIELCLPDSLAIASINRHGDFFGQRFDIQMADKSPAHSACVAFGLDRWAAHKATTI